MTVADALKQVGRYRATYEYWRKTDPEFRRKIDTLRLARKDPTLANVDFRDFRMTFFGMETFWHHQQMIDAIESAAPQSITMILAPPEHAKGLALDTPLPTPTGWTTMGDVQVG